MFAGANLVFARLRREPEAKYRDGPAQCQGESPLGGDNEASNPYLRRPGVSAPYPSRLPLLCGKPKNARAGIFAPYRAIAEQMRQAFEERRP